MDRSFLDANIPELVQRLSTDEKISLLGAPNWWNTTPIKRLGVPSVRMSDGPNVRSFYPDLYSLADSQSRVYEDHPISSQLLHNVFLFGTYSVDLAINAGMELEMPGPPRWRTPLLVNHMLGCQKVLPAAIDERVTTLLTFVQRQAKRNPEVVYGDGKERTRDSEEARQFTRKLAAEGMVLLKNNGPVLPIKPVAEKIVKVAIIGPNAKERIISGGGSAALKASYIVTPFDGLTGNAPQGIECHYEVGCYAYKFLPTLENLLKTPAGEPGWACSFYNHDENGNPIGSPVAEFVLQDTRIKLNDFLPAGLTPTWTIKLNGTLVVEKTAQYELGLTVSGRAKLWIDGVMTIDNWTAQRPGEFFYGQGTVEEKGLVDLEAGKPVDVYVEYTNTKPPSGPESDRSQPALMRGVRLGGCEKIDPDKAIEAAVRLAAESDVVIIVAGLSPEWESEGFDRPTLDMPGRQNELISRVGKANRNTVVCLQAVGAFGFPDDDSS
ncbi:hypothetical protein PHLCEN_2v9301 [Hermanssonia centrifuga]|uniref:beta-glucosidase n=1 Tax=Hermanssonia centrifuga TaxID=98765 RepID=A0A2R6NR39_9APHY|nr:hypothetical protein PHLCEN_2v9301 [Hermanssonia centrifuga]